MTGEPAAKGASPTSTNEDLDLGGRAAGEVPGGDYHGPAGSEGRGRHRRGAGAPVAGEAAQERRSSPDSRSLSSRAALAATLAGDRHPARAS
jgi:hypothetical protein